MGRVTSRWRSRTSLLTILGFGATFVILGILVYRERAAILLFPWQIHGWSLVAAFVLLLGTIVLAALAWTILLRLLGSPLPRSLHVRYYVISHLARRLPGTLWYIAGRGYLYRQHGESVRLITIASSIELVLMTVAGGLFTLALWGAALRQLPMTYLAALAVTVVLGVLLTRPASIGWLLRRVGLGGVPALSQGNMLVLLAIYFFTWLLAGILFFCLVRGITGIGPEHLAYLAASWSLVGTLSVLVFFLPSNFGFTEVGLSLLLSAVMPSSVAVVVAILTRVIMIGFELIAAALAFGLLHLIEGRAASGRPTETR